MSEHTPGPWRWEVNPKHKQVELCGGKPRFDTTVMEFVRWGMNSAQPRFNASILDTPHCVMKNAIEFALAAPGREHHTDWFRLIDHPDANLIAAAPDLLAALDEILNYDGGADSALQDEYVMERARAAIEAAKGGPR